MTWVRMACHVHSSHSDDATTALPRLVRILARAGYGGALVCDHDRTLDERQWRDLVDRCAEASRADFLVVPGVEYQDPDHVVHTPVFGATVPFLGRGLPTTDLVQEAHARGGATMMAHPARRGAALRFDPAWVPYLSGLEVWNRKYDGYAPNTWALRTAQSHGITPVVALDYHTPRQLFPLALHVRVPADRPATADAVVHALRAGAVRATAFGMTAPTLGREPVASTARVAEQLRRPAAAWLRAAQERVRP